MATSQNTGRGDSENPQDANQSNPGNDVRVFPGDMIHTEQVTDSTWLSIPTTVEVNGINYGPGIVKVAKTDADKVLDADDGIVEVSQPKNEHHGAKPMPEKLDGPDYV